MGFPHYSKLPIIINKKYHNVVGFHIIQGFNTVINNTVICTILLYYLCHPPVRMEQGFHLIHGLKG
jgi:hypothetical protein